MTAYDAEISAGSLLPLRSRRIASLPVTDPDSPAWHNAIETENILRKKKLALRAEYVVPLTGKIQSRIDILQKDFDAAVGSAARNKLAKEVGKLKKKHSELLACDEQLCHHADKRISLDLDDGVKVNYGKFGDFLAEVKAVTGGKDDE